MACCVEDSDFEEQLKQPISGPHQQGYDYEFIPDLDSKYECPICLLCQREPMQTSCGHRFCRDCILTWLRSESQRCPEDNSPITPEDVFPDNFAKREILCLRARCPNTKHGCEVIMELLKMDEHQNTCDYRTVACPQGCPMLLLFHDVNDHVEKECLYRVIECSLCFAKFPLNQQQLHFATCAMVSLQCNFCQVNLSRQDLPQHVRNECPNVAVACPFFDVGCDKQVNRGELQDHLTINTQVHLKLLNVAHGRLRSFVEKMAVAMQSVEQLSNVKEAPRSLSPRILQMPEKAMPPVQINMEQLSIQKNDASVTNGNVDPTGNGLLSMDPRGANSILPEKSLLSSAEGLMRELFQRNVQLEQRHREQELKMGVLQQRVAECETQVALMSERVATSEARFCNGVYLWTVDGFSRFVHEARNIGHSRLLHSPGFYTSAFGYKLCLRLNVVTKDHMEFLSLFIHLMHGEFDDAVRWPFDGQITFSVVDCSEQRAHIVETMMTKPSLVAFHRPLSERNPKGFGYTEFVSIDTLLKGGYICNDTLLIKAVIKTSLESEF